ncbi:unnamed protein product, partial [Amoebophrya sp. A120]|eukprot:GSA120T00016948001.1
MTRLSWLCVLSVSGRSFFSSVSLSLALPTWLLLNSVPLLETSEVFNIVKNSTTFSKFAFATEVLDTTLAGEVPADQDDTPDTTQVEAGFNPEEPDAEQTSDEKLSEHSSASSGRTRTYCPPLPNFTYDLLRAVEEANWVAEKDVVRAVPSYETSLQLFSGWLNHEWVKVKRWGGRDRTTSTTDQKNKMDKMDEELSAKKSAPFLVRFLQKTAASVPVSRSRTGKKKNDHKYSNPHLLPPKKKQHLLRSFLRKEFFA